MPEAFFKVKDFMANIFVSVGTHMQQFDRLFKELDEIAMHSADCFFAQIGHSAFIPKNFEFKKFLNAKEYLEKMKWADIVISHGGAGTIINALNAGKKLVIVPRLKKFGEHTDDHQIDLAKSFESGKKAIAVYEITGLKKSIELAKKFKPSLESSREKLLKEIENYLNGLE